MCTVNEETTFHGFVREVYEETGFRVVEAKSMVESEIRFETLGKSFKRQWLKLTFEVIFVETDCGSNKNHYCHVNVLLNPETPGDQHD